MVLKILSELIDNLSKGYVGTRRDIYYRDVSLFKNQGNVDSIVRLISDSLGFKDFEIGVVAAQKGLFLGEITLVFDNEPNVTSDNTCLEGESSSAHNEVTFKNDSIAKLIPKLYNVKMIKCPTRIKYILIIEKEAVFNALCNVSPSSYSVSPIINPTSDTILDQNENSSRILITGKGFPDQLTRQFINMLKSTNPWLKVYGICDLDPYGINILRQYKNGTQKDKEYRYEANDKHNEGTSHFSCPDLIPLNNSIYQKLNTLHKSKHLDSSLLDLTQRECKMIFKNFKTWQELTTSSPSLSSNESFNQENIRFNNFIKQELQRMLFLGKKCELNTMKLKDGIDQGIPIVEFINKLCSKETNNESDQQ